MRVVDSLLRFNRYFFCSRARCRLRAPSGPNAGFTLNPKKFFFAQESVERVGYIVQRGGILRQSHQTKSDRQLTVATGHYWALLIFGLGATPRRFLQFHKRSLIISAGCYACRTPSSRPQTKRKRSKTPKICSSVPRFSRSSTRSRKSFNKRTLFNQTRNGYAHHLHALTLADSGHGGHSKVQRLTERYTPFIFTTAIENTITTLFFLLSSATISIITD